MSAKTHLDLCLIFFFFAQFNFNVPERDVMLYIRSYFIATYFLFKTVCFFCEFLDAALVIQASPPV